MSFQVVAVHGIGLIHPGDDLAALIAARIEETSWPDGTTGLRDGDIVVITSKVVSKSEGQVVSAPDATSRDAVIAAQTERVVAERGHTRIVQTRHGLVLAAAGVDSSNTEPGTLVLLPEDPDASARRLRADLVAHLQVRLGVIITDTMGRPWRMGLVDHAIGVAGVRPILDLRGQTDLFGRALERTLVALVDEMASAAELVRPKAGGLPVALIRGLGDHVLPDDGPGAQALIRSAAEDLFPTGVGRTPSTDNSGVAGEPHR